MTEDGQILPKVSPPKLRHSRFGGILIKCGLLQVGRLDRTDSSVKLRPSVNSLRPADMYMSWYNVTLPQRLGYLRP